MAKCKLNYYRIKKNNSVTSINGTELTTTGAIIIENMLHYGTQRQQNVNKICTNQFLNQPTMCINLKL